MSSVMQRKNVRRRHSTSLPALLLARLSALLLARLSARLLTRLSALLLALLGTSGVAACGDDGGGNSNNQQDPCADVDCGPHGDCFPEQGLPACECDSGYRPEGLTCVRENRPPTFTNLPTEAVAAVYGEGVFDVDATDLDGGDLLRFEITGSTCSFETTMDPSSGVVQWTCGAEEPCRVFMEVSDDGEPPRSDTDTLYLSCETGVPEFRTTPPLLAHEHEEYRYDVECRAPFGGAVSLSLLPEHDCAGALIDGGDGTGLLRFTPGELEGGTSCSVAVACAGSTATATQLATVAIAEINAPPSLTNLPTTVHTHWSDSAYFDVLASDASDVPPNPWSVTLGQDGCSFAPWVDGDHRIRWTCDGVESCAVEVYAVDQGSPPRSAFASLSIVCDNSTPVLSTASATAYAEVPYTYDALCTDADLDPLTFAVGASDTCGGSLTALGPGQRRYEFTPPAGAAGTTCELHVLCSDSQDSAVELRTIHIQ